MNNKDNACFGSTDIRYRGDNKHDQNDQSTAFRRPNTDNEIINELENKENENNRYHEHQNHEKTSKKEQFDATLANNQLIESARRLTRYTPRETVPTKAHKYLMKQGLILASVEKCALDEATNTQIQGLMITKYENRFKLTQAKLEFRHHQNEYFSNQCFKVGEPVTFFAEWISDKYEPGMNDVLLEQQLERQIFPDESDKKLPHNFFQSGTILEVKNGLIAIGTKPHWQYNYFVNNNSNLFTVKACALNVDIKRQQKALKWLNQIDKKENGERNNKGIPSTAPGGINLLNIFNDKPVGRCEAIKYEKYHQDPIFRFCVGDPIHAATTSWALNDSQRRAIAHCKESADNFPISVIHGPPGTGKTKTLSSFIFQSILEGKRLLVTAQSNNAVDKLLSEVINLWKKVCEELKNKEAERQSTFADGSDTSTICPADLDSDIQSYTNEFFMNHERDPSILGTETSISGGSAIDPRAFQDKVKQILKHKMVEKNIPLSPDDKTAKLPIVRIGNSLRFSEEIVSDYSLESKLFAKHPEVAQRYFELNEFCVEPIEPGLEPRGEGEFSRNTNEQVGEKLSIEVNKLQPILLEARAIFTTVSSSCAFSQIMKGIKRMSDEHFDVCVIDEASQCLETSSFIPMLQAPKTILAGDHHQLPPIIPNSVIKDVNNLKLQILQGVDPFSDKNNDNDTQSEISFCLENPSEIRQQEVRDFESAAVKKFLTHTLMERIDSNYPMLCSKLKIQYRMNKKIVEWSNKTFYNNQIETYHKVESQTLDDLKGIKLTAINKLYTKSYLGDSYPPLVYIDTPHTLENDEQKVDTYFTELETRLTNDSKANMGEAAVCVSYCRFLCDICYLSQDDIGIITPYSEQVTLIKHGLKQYALDKIVCSSVDGFQGQEREVILLSLVRCNAYNTTGFLKDLRRMNVAITRAKRHIWIIGNYRTMEEGSKELGGFVKFFTSSVACKRMFYRDFIFHTNTTTLYTECVDVLIKYINKKLKEMGVADKYDKDRGYIRGTYMSERRNLDTWTVEGQEPQKNLDEDWILKDDQNYAKPHNFELCTRIKKASKNLKRVEQKRFNVANKQKIKNYQSKHYDYTDSWVQQVKSEDVDSVNGERDSGIVSERGIGKGKNSGGGMRSYGMMSGSSSSDVSVESSIDTDSNLTSQISESSSDDSSSSGSGDTYVSSVISL